MVVIKRNGQLAFQLGYNMLSLTVCVYQDAEDEYDDGGESEEEEAEESDSELEEEGQEEEKEDRAAIPCSKEPPAPSPAPLGTKGPQKTAARHSEEVGID